MTTPFPWYRFDAPLLALQVPKMISHVTFSILFNVKSKHDLHPTQHTPTIQCHDEFSQVTTMSMTIEKCTWGKASSHHAVYYSIDRKIIFDSRLQLFCLESNEMALCSTFLSWKAENCQQHHRAAVNCVTRCCCRQPENVECGNERELAIRLTRFNRNTQNNRVNSKRSNLVQLITNGNVCLHWNLNSCHCAMVFSSFVQVWPKNRRTNYSTNWSSLRQLNLWRQSIDRMQWKMSIDGHWKWYEIWSLCKW